MVLNKIIRALLVSTGFLVVPLVASQFVDGWIWTSFDYLFAWVMFSFVSLVLTFALSSVQSAAYKIAASLAVLTTFLFIWINAAVGIIGEGDYPNGLYAGVLLVGLIGAAVARLKPEGMAKTLFGMAAAQMAVPVVALFIWSPEVVSWAPGVALVFGLNAVFAAMFVASALLFRRAAA